MLQAVFWVAAGLLVYAQVGYALLLVALDALRRQPAPRASDATPSVSLIVAAYREEAEIAAKVAEVRGLDYPPECLELIVCCDGSDDATPQRARAAGADRVLELPRTGKTGAQNAGAREARGEVLAFSDANSRWRPDALRRLVAAFADPQVGYACGHLELLDQGGGNQEGLYWRYETAMRALESRLASVTAGNGAIYATRREAYVELDAGSSHDLAFPFTMVKHGWRATYAPSARATEHVLPTIEGEFARKRRMMRRGWPIVLRGGMLSPRGYGPLYAVMIASHRVLRYATPFLHVAVLAANAALVARGASALYLVTLALQLALLASAALAGVVPLRMFLLARYYVLTTASVAAGLWDWLRHGPLPGWEPAPGAR
ncbi:MAG: glycosyltransferase [Actinomycetota bacterium]|nr:glycosyltransferase [Actinomycetota bacterium]